MIAVIPRRKPLARGADNPAGKRRAACGGHLSKEEIGELRGLLLAKRRELIADMLCLSSQIEGMSGAGEITNAPLERSAEWEEAEVNAGLLNSEWAQLREIDEALARMSNGTYGVCAAPGKPIGVARLRARPWAKYCIEYARQLENKQVRPPT